MKITWKRRLAAGATAAAVLALTACGGGSGGDAEGGSGEGEKVTIEVGSLPSTEKPEAREAFMNDIEQFEAANPDITVEGVETQWAADTFQAMVAGGTMPTVLEVPFTEIASIIERGQAAEVTDLLADSEVLSNLNPNVQNNVTTDDDKVWGVPVFAYTMGLLYNRALFEQAGLDPDVPPATWDEVREAAKTITETTGVQGFQAMTLENAGGWALTATTNGFGGRLANDDGTEVSVDNDATKEALEFYRQLRWEDNTFGSNFLLNYGDASNAFASGQAGMFVMGADQYWSMVVNLGMAPEDFGVAPMPQAEEGAGTLAGGTVTIISPQASEAEKAAGIKWIEYSYFERFMDEEVALTQAQADNEAGSAVGGPELRIVSAELYDRWLGWVDEYVNVPRENYDAYLSTVEDIPLVPEPAKGAQEIYALLDPVVQAVLTREDADIDALLAEAQTTAQQTVDNS